MTMARAILLGFGLVAGIIPLNGLMERSQAQTTPASSWMISAGSGDHAFAIDQTTGRVKFCIDGPNKGCYPIPDK